MSRRISRTPIALAVVAASFLAQAGAPAGAAQPASRLLFDSFRDGDWELYLGAADGSAQTQLTFTSFHETDAAWSPDRSAIAFTQLFGGSGIYRMNADGSDPRFVTSYGSELSWSPDGSTLAFNAGGDIYLVNADGTNRRNITPTSIDYDGHPDWSPDGTRIAFDSHRSGGTSKIFVMQADGSGVTRLTNGSSEFDPDWSPDGTRIAFQGSTQPVLGVPARDIFVMDADGTEQRNITNATSNVSNQQPDWSPDGGRIAFSSTRAYPSWESQNHDIYVMPVAGGPAVRVTDHPGPDFRPKWEPPVPLIPTSLVAGPVVARVQPTALYLGRLEATLTETASGSPVSGRVVRFRARRSDVSDVTDGAFGPREGEELCSGITNPVGVATCAPEPTALARAVSGMGYHAVFSGDDEFVAASAEATLLD